MQNLVVVLIVLACTGYAAWTLMPSAWRRATAGALLRFPLPSRFAQAMRKASTVSSGCGCDGCDAGAKPAAKAPQVVHFHPRARR